MKHLCKLKKYLCILASIIKNNNEKKTNLNLSLEFDHLPLYFGWLSVTNMVTYIESCFGFYKWNIFGWHNPWIIECVCVCVCIWNIKDDKERCQWTNKNDLHKNDDDNYHIYKKNASLWYFYFCFIYLDLLLLIYGMKKKN